jgi:hypothetical protein
MHKNATKCHKTLSKWCKNKHGASKIIDTFETYQGAMSEGGREALTRAWRGQGWGRTTLWCGRLLALLRLSFGLRLRVSKIGTSAFILSNSKNISRIIFLKYKNSRKQELALWYLINRLVPENA